MLRGSSKTKARVDVLIPYWGDFKLLKKAVDSVRAQTEEDWTLLIVDDCYPSDEAHKYYSSFKDKRVKYYRHKQNIGLVKNYNYALSQATSEHCVIMGCDDIMLPSYLENALARVGAADIYHPSVGIIDGEGKSCFPLTDRIKKFLRPRKHGILAGESAVISLCHGNWTYFPSILWKTKTLRKYGFDQRLPNTHDLVTILYIIIGGGTLYNDDEKTFLYRRSSFSFSSKAKNGSRFTEEQKVYSRLGAEFQELGWLRASRVAKLHITSRVHKIFS